MHDYLVNDYSRIQSGDAKGCFFHKDIYPDQMWLDGIYMGAAFYAEWQANFDPDNEQAWTDIAHQFKTVARHTYDADKQLFIMPGLPIRRMPTLFGQISGNLIKDARKSFGDVVWVGILQLW